MFLFPMEHSLWEHQASANNHLFIVRTACVPNENSHCSQGNIKSNSSLRCVVHTLKFFRGLWTDSPSPPPPNCKGGKHYLEEQVWLHIEKSIKRNSMTNLKTKCINSNLFYIADFTVDFDIN